MYQLHLPKNPIPSKFSYQSSHATGASDKPCSDGLSELDAFLYGLPGGFLLAGIVLLCFIMFGNALTHKPARKEAPSMSSNTRLDKKNLLGKKNKRGPPPSQDLRPLDMNQLALREDAPDDIKAMVMAGKLGKNKTSSVSTRSTG